MMAGYLKLSTFLQDVKNFQNQLILTLMKELRVAMVGNSVVGPSKM